jgi:hypothetical protein
VARSANRLPPARSKVFLESPKSRPPNCQCTR